MFVKICGMTNESDALFAVAMGANAVGFVFAPSPRQVAPSLVRDIIRRLPSEVTTIGVFRDEATQRIVDIVNTCGLGGVQLHGHEAPAECAWVRDRVPLLIKAFPVGDHLLERVDEYTAADALLIDGPTPGSGTSYDWGLVDLLPRNRRVIVAGGLTPDNVSEAILRTGAWGVDVATGVEAAPGHKDARKVFRFCQIAKSHDAPVFEGDHLLMPLDFDLDDYGDGFDLTGADRGGPGIPSQADIDELRRLDSLDHPTGRDRDDDGFVDGDERSFDGYDDGYDDGFDDGFDEGFDDQRREDGRARTDVDPYAVTVHDGDGTAAPSLPSRAVD